MTFELFGVLSRWAVFTGLLVAIGAIVFDMWVLRGSADVGEADAGRGGFPVARAAARFAVLAAVLLLLGSLGRLVAELAIFRDPFEPWRAELDLLVTGTSFGSAWLTQFGLAVLACLVFVAVSRTAGVERGAPLARGLAAVITFALAVTPAFSGHAAGSADYRALAIGSDVVHVLAGGAWLGTLAVIAGVSARARRLGAPVPRERLIEWIGRFSPLALCCAALLGLTGVVASWLHLDAISSLWRTPYGQRLLIKLGVLGVILGFGAYNWKRSRGRVAVSGDPARLPGSVAAELAAGLVILLVTAVLVTTPPPGE